LGKKQKVGFFIKVPLQNEHKRILGLTTHFLAGFYNEIACVIIVFTIFKTTSQRSLKEEVWKVPVIERVPEITSLERMPTPRMAGSGFMRQIIKVT